MNGTNDILINSEEMIKAGFCHYRLWSTHTISVTECENAMSLQTRRISPVHDDFSVDRLKH